MENLKGMWQKTRREFNEKEKSLVDLYMSFLREVAKIYVAKNRKIYFRENKHTHWGEGGFGRLYIEGEEDAPELFGSYVGEVQFFNDLSEIKEFLRDDFIRIGENNLNSIKYEMETRLL